jgi:hypothetical protein
MPPAALLLLPHDVLVHLFERLDTRILARLAATCRLLRYGQSSPQTPNAVEDALRHRTGSGGWSSPLPVDSREAVRELLTHVRARIARRDQQLLSVAVGMECPLSLFIDSSGRLRSCGVERPPPANDRDAYWLVLVQPAHVGALGFGRDWEGDEVASGALIVALPKRVPATAGVRFRSVVTEVRHSLALTEEGEIFSWTSDTAGGSALPTLFQSLQGHRVGRVAVGSYHSTAVTDCGELFTWWENQENGEDTEDSASGLGLDPEVVYEGLGYLISADLACRRPRRVPGLDGVRIVSVAAGCNVTVTDTGQRPSPRGCRQKERV